jgi:DNA-binding CsgD family transcriptional regulator
VLYELLLPYAERHAVTTPHVGASNGPVARYLGLLATTMSRWEEATRQFEAALELSTRAGMPHFQAHCSREYAAMLLVRHRNGNLPRARELLAQALAIYDELGMGHYAAKTQALLRLRPLARALRFPSYPNGLTAREVEVVRLIAAAKSNRQIADELVISHNTVIRHVSNIFVKTNAANRAAVVAFAHRYGLL